MKMKIILALDPKEIIVKFGLLSDKTIEIVDSDSKSEVWVSNVGNVNCCYPSDLRGDTKIEVKRRNGTKLSGVASIWRTSWQEAAGLCTADIVAYRIL